MNTIEFISYLRSLDINPRTKEERLEAQLAYWKQQLDPTPSLLELPADRPRPAIQTFHRRRQTLKLSQALTEALKALSQQEHVSLFMTLLAAFKTLLYRYSGQTDLAVGVPIASRNPNETDGLSSFFANTLVLRTGLADNPTFQQFLAQVREVCLAAYIHRDLPFEKLVEELHLPRDPSHNPLFQVMFVLQDTPKATLDLPNPNVTPLPLNHQTAKFDLTLYLTETIEGLTAIMEYNSDLFEPATIQRMLDHFQTLLAGIVADSAQHLSTLPLLTQAEQRQLLIEWNDTYRPYPQTDCIHHLFEAQVEQTPEATAFIFAGERLTYRELNRQANHLAHYLQRLGVGPETLVGVCLKRSLEMVVGLLGILKAGGVYVPLDPAYPQERLAFMLQDTQAPLLLTQQSLVAGLPPHQAQIVCLDSDWPAIAQESELNLVVEVTSNQPVYVAYTSGSTGVPKGVLGLHRGAINRFRWMWEAYPFEAGEVCCQKTTLNFVDSVWEIFGPLLQGVPTLIIPDEVLKDAPRLVQSLAVNQVTRIVLVPSLLRLMLDLYPNLQSQLPQLKIWVSSGEALSLDLAQRFQERLPQSTLLNLYGSSEVSADSTFYEIKPGQPLTTVPIGRPIANTQIYLLDQQLNLVPVGVPGELFIGGEGLARGYLHRPDLTAEKFIHHPFATAADARLYKTGDVARYLPDGNLDYLGRTDHQVKIRGIRIELGEIEAALRQHPALQAVVVLTREDVPGDKRLVAYASSNPEQRPTANELHRFLKEKLPDYMIPSTFVLLDSLPLTPNGKINRLALPKPDQSQSDMSKEFMAPRTKLECQLAQMWETLLGIQPIGLKDNFFELGGHSLLAVRLFSQIEQAFGVNLPLASLFQAATLEDLANLISQPSGITTWPLLVELQPQGSKPPFFCIHGITGDVLWFRELALQLTPDQPFYGIQAQGLDGVQQPFSNIEAMAAQYITEIRAFQPKGPYFLGGASFGGTVALEMSQQLLAQGEEVALLVMFDHVPSNLEPYLKQQPEVSKIKNVLKILGNFPYWFNNFLRLSPPEMLARLQRKVRVTQKISGGKLNQLYLKLDQVDAADIIDYAAELPVHQQQLIEAHYQASAAYIPQPYPGRVILFQAQAQPLFQSLDPAVGWQTVAEGVEVKIIPGSHEGMFKTPHVQILAEQLRRCMGEVLKRSLPKKLESAKPLEKNSPRYLCTFAVIVNLMDFLIPCLAA